MSDIEGTPRRFWNGSGWTEDTFYVIGDKINMNHEPTRLAAIVWLRENGWTVEPK